MVHIQADCPMKLVLLMLASLVVLCVVEDTYLVFQPFLYVVV